MRMMHGYVIKLENGMYAHIEHDSGTHVRVDSVDSLLFATLFSNHKEAQEYEEEMTLYQKYGLGIFEGEKGSMHQFHGKCVIVKEVREIELKEK
jgi:hypothetical protein